MIARFGDLPADERCRATKALASARATDVERWSRAQNLKSNWAERARIAAQLVPQVVRLLDIGCGSMVERFLDPSVTCLPRDVVGRDERTTDSDFNARMSFAPVISAPHPRDDDTDQKRN